jgi:hypothetical protein
LTSENPTVLQYCRWDEIKVMTTHAQLLNAPRLRS